MKGSISGEYIGTTIGIHSPFPTEPVSGTAFRGSTSKDGLENEDSGEQQRSCDGYEPLALALSTSTPSGRTRSPI